MSQSEAQGGKSALLEVLDQGRALVINWQAGLTAEEQAEAGTLAHWSARDCLAHIATWHEQLALAIDLHGKGEPVPEVWQETDEQNARFFWANSNVSWAQAETRAAAAYAALRWQVERLSEADLEQLDDFAWREGQPLWRTIAGNGCRHPASHIADYYLKRGQSDHALAVAEQITAIMARLDPSAHGRGTDIYNLACTYALAGRVDSALANLQHALQLRPELSEWAQEDPDLASLRDDPTFNALLTNRTE